MSDGFVNETNYPEFNPVFFMLITYCRKTATFSFEKVFNLKKKSINKHLSEAFTKNTMQLFLKTGIDQEM